MATSGKAHGKALVFKLDTQAGTLTDISAYVKSVDGLPGEVEMGDVTVGGSAGYKYYPGLQKADFSIECVFDDTANSAYDLVKNFMSDTNTRSFEFGPAGNTSGFAKILGECRIKKVSLSAKVTDILTFTVDMSLDNDLTIGTWV